MQIHSSAPESFLYSRICWKYSASTHLTYLLSVVFNIQLHFIAQCWHLLFLFSVHKGQNFFSYSNVCCRVQRKTLEMLRCGCSFHLEDLVRVIKNAPAPRCLPVEKKEPRRLLGTLLPPSHVLRIEVAIRSTMLRRKMYVYAR